jgi:hypothetical protein
MLANLSDMFIHCKYVSNNVNVDCKRIELGRLCSNRGDAFNQLEQALSGRLRQGLLSTRHPNAGAPGLEWGEANDVDDPALQFIRKLL